MKAEFIRKEKRTATDIYSFYFRPDREVKFLAGQYTELTLDGVGSHWFTISSYPDKKELTITTRLTGSDFKNVLKSLVSGSKVALADPMGDFVLPKDRSIPLLFVAAGIGLTPFLSILGDCLVKKDHRQFNLIYAASSQTDFIDLKPYLKLMNGFRKLVGPLRSSDILTQAKKLERPYIYLSGPEKLVEKLVSELKSNGIAENSLIADYFPGYD